MGAINADIKNYAAIWDFSVDGGAIGTINLGMILPKGFCVANATALIINQPTSAGLANISFGIAGIGTSALFVTAPFTDWASDNVFHTVQPTDAFNFQPPVLANGGMLTFSIFGAALTGGKIAISVFGTQFGAGF